jgi:hypothetical protein
MRVLYASRPFETITFRSLIDCHRRADLKVGPINGREGRRSRLRLKASVAPLPHAVDAVQLRPETRVDYLPHYDMDHTKPKRRAAFLGKVEATFLRW